MRTEKVFRWKESGDWRIKRFKIPEDLGVDPETACEFTEEYDDELNEIFENDIVKFKVREDEEEYKIGKVEKFGVGFLIKELNSTRYCILDEVAEIVVIGNIFDEEVEG